MDFIIFGGIALFLAAKTLLDKNTEYDNRGSIMIEDTTREARLNDSFYEDSLAFCKLLQAVGFLEDEQ